MSEELTRTFQTMRKLRDQLLAGQIFRTVPDAIDDVMANIVPEAATPVVIPDDDIKALGRIRTIEARVKHTKTPAVSDDEVAFLIDHLASLSPAVRDKGVFFLINDLLQMQAFSGTQIAWMVARLQEPDMMFAHILEPQNDAIFRRSFTVMILAGLIFSDTNHYHVLSAADYSQITLSLSVYIVLERDGRGFVDPYGWAHAYTHIGNVLDELTSVPSLARGQKLFLMLAVLAGWQQMVDPLIYGEDQRIALYLTNLTAKHQFYAESLVMGLTHWQQRLLKMRPQQSARFWNRWYNRNRLLGALVMRADLPKVVADYLQKIIDLY